MLQTGRHFFTSESVTEGHPDKIADQISDAVLDAVLRDDPSGRVACETLVTTGLAFIAGEITTKTYVDLPAIVRQTIKEIGYTRAKFGFDYETCAVMVADRPPVADIAQGVDTGGAGDQGMMFGYACDETEELMPLPITLAHQLVQRLSEARRKGELDFLRPDGKSQVTVEYDGKPPLRVDTVVVSTQHARGIKHETLSEAIIEEVIKPVIPARAPDGRHQVPHQPDGPVRHRRPAGRLRADRAQDHRRHLRRLGPPRRRRVLRQGSDQGRSLGRVHGPLHRQEHRGRRPGRRAAKCSSPTRSASPSPVSVHVDTFGTGKLPESASSALVARSSR